MDSVKWSKKQTIFLMIFFVAMVLIDLLQSIPADDFWWHLKTGEVIVINKALPKTPFLSWTKGDFSWICHEWLFDVFIYLSSLVFGITGSIYFYLILSIALISLTIFLYCKKSFERNPLWMMMCAVILLYLVGTVDTARPHMFIIWIFLLYCMLCEKMKTSDTKIWLLCIPITIFWTNWYGGSACITYLIPFIYFITNTLNLSVGRVDSVKSIKSWRYLLMTIISFLCVMCNPYTYKMILFPFIKSSEQYKYITEWAGPSWNSYPFVICGLIISVLVLTVTSKRINFCDFAMIGVFAFLTIMHVRFCGYLAIVACIYLTKYISEVKVPDIEKWMWAVFGSIGIAILCMLSCIIMFIDPYEHNALKVVPDEAIEILKEESPERLYNSYYLGGYLIYNDIPVFIDARGDMYDDILEDSYSAIAFYKSFKEIDEKYNFDMYIVYDYEYAYTWLKENNYEEIWHDEDSKLAILK